ncbi:hypothetical protein BC829DRAFT_71030 [Chytridium lagenaria]|nr:hypothetical protein BC829DRAFT_71030 [Chytridium lagenaria]
MKSSLAKASLEISQQHTDGRHFLLVVGAGPSENVNLTLTHGQPYVCFIPFSSDVIESSAEINVYDVFWLFQDCDAIVYEFPSVNPSVYSQEFTTLDDLKPLYSIPCHDFTMESLEILAENGSVEEVFATDDLGDSFDKGLQQRGRRSMLLAPNESFREDINFLIFEDIWSEIIPIFEAFLSEAQDPFKSREMPIGDSSEEPFSATDSLLRAITIRPVASPEARAFCER